MQCSGVPVHVDSLQQLVGEQLSIGERLFDAFLGLPSFKRAASFSRDHLMCIVPARLSAFHRLVDSFLLDLVSHMTSILPAQ